MLRSVHAWMVLALLGLAVQGYAQPGAETPQGLRRLSVLADGGITRYFGDIDGKVTPQGGLYLSYYISPAFAFEAGGRIGYLANQDNEEYGRVFRNDFFTYEGRLKISFLQFMRSSVLPNPRFAPYAVIGIGGLRSDVSDVEQSADFGLGTSASGERLGEVRNYTATDLVYIAGLGATVYLNERWDLRLVYTHYFSNTEMLDGHYWYGGTNRFNDQLGTLSVGVTLKLGDVRKQHIAWNTLPVGGRSLVSEPQYAMATDRDNDGVPDQFDLEPNTATGIRVDTRGRALDTDYDGVPDHADPCPLVAGDSSGCPTDLNLNSRVVRLGVEPARYYIIAGSMMDRDNAVEMLNGLLQAGQVEARLLEKQYDVPGQSDPKTFYRVAIHTFEDRSRALNTLERLRRDVDPNLWLYFE